MIFVRQDKFCARSLRDSKYEMMAALHLQVSIVSQALIFVRRSRSWSFVERPGLLLVSAFVVAQLVKIHLIRQSLLHSILYKVQVPGNPLPAVRTYPPVEHPVVVIGPQYLAQYPVELGVSTKLWTLGENDFKVSDINGTLIFQIKSKLLSLHDRRFLKDAAGNTLVNLRQKIRTMHRRWEAFRGESKEEKDLLFTAKKSKLFQFKTELDIFLANNKGEVPDFKVKGGYGESSCSILVGDSNTMLAQMHRLHSLTTMILDTDSFGVTVYPNVDYAFIVALVVILDEINADRSGED